MMFPEALFGCRVASLEMTKSISTKTLTCPPCSRLKNKETKTDPTLKAYKNYKQKAGI
jgi:hypothetical protein